MFTLSAGLCLIMASLVAGGAWAPSTPYTKRLVCFYDHSSGSRASPATFTIADIDPNLCTHVIYGSADIDASHNLIQDAADTNNYATFNQMKQNTPLVTLLSVGGVNFNVQKFRDMVSTQQNRAAFIMSAITLLRANNFDGLNVDWQFPEAQDKTQFTLLCQELETAFAADGTATSSASLYLTASVSAEKAVIDDAYDVPQISPKLDFINVLTYNFRSHSDGVTGHHSPLNKGNHDTGNKLYSNTADGMQYWKNLGAPAKKLNMGIAAFARTFKISGSSNVGDPATGPGDQGTHTATAGFLAHFEYCSEVQRIAFNWITDQSVPYDVVSNDWIGYDNIYSIIAKVKYLKAHSFGGVFVSSLDLDDFSGTFCGLHKYPFINHLRGLLLPGPHTGDFCAGKPNGIYPNPDDQRSFYNCAHWLTYRQYCPLYLVLDPVSKCCMHDTTIVPVIPLPPTGTFCIGKAPGIYADPDDETKFFSCDHGITYSISCPSGLVFEPINKCCTYPTYANPIFCKGKADGLHADPNDATSYYNCYYQLTYHQHCPTGLLYHAAISQCDYPNPTVPVIINVPTFCTGRSDGAYADPDDTRSYYDCDNQGTTHKTCQTGFLFDSVAKTCTFPDPCSGMASGIFPNTADETTFICCVYGITYILDCPASLIFDPLKLTCTYSTTTNPDFCIGKADGLYANDADETTFFNCCHQLTYLQSCPESLVFDEDKGYCNYATSTTTTNTMPTAFCYGRQDGTYANPTDEYSYYMCVGGTDYMSPCSDMSWTSQCGCCNYVTPYDHDYCIGKADGRYANYDDLTTFYTCTHQITYLQYCPQTLVFDTHLGVCNYATAINLNFCAGKADGLYTNTADDTSYYNCCHGLTFLQYCQAYLVFDQSCGCCNYDPTNTVVPGASTDTFCEDLDDGLYSHTDPSKFYNCCHGLTFIQSCPGTLIFSDADKKCDYPK